jgi:hypothetical protein
MVVIEATQNNTATEEQVKETTQQLIDQTQKNLTPDEAASMVFKYYWPQYRMLVSKLSNKDARRLNEAVIGFPLEVTEKNFYSTEAKEAFKLAKTLMDAKFILQQKVIGEAISKLETKTETVNEGENNNG